jgi:hypothetical protein
MVQVATSVLIDPLPAQVVAIMGDPQQNPRWLGSIVTALRQTRPDRWTQEPPGVLGLRQPGGDEDVSRGVTLRSWTTPQAWQTQARTPSGLGPSRYPHAEQVC